MDTRLAILGAAFLLFVASLVYFVHVLRVAGRERRMSAQSGYLLSEDAADHQRAREALQEPLRYGAWMPPSVEGEQPVAEQVSAPVAPPVIPPPAPVEPMQPAEEAAAPWDAVLSSIDAEISAADAAAPDGVVAPAPEPAAGAEAPAFESLPVAEADLQSPQAAPVPDFPDLRITVPHTVEALSDPGPVAAAPTAPEPVPEPAPATEPEPAPEPAPAPDAVLPAVREPMSIEREPEPEPRPLPEPRPEPQPLAEPESEPPAVVQPEPRFQPVTPQAFGMSFPVMPPAAPEPPLVASAPVPTAAPVPAPVSAVPEAAPADEEGPLAWMLSLAASLGEPAESLTTPAAAPAVPAGDEPPFLGAPWAAAPPAVPPSASVSPAAPPPGSAPEMPPFLGGQPSPAAPTARRRRERTEAYGLVAPVEMHFADRGKLIGVREGTRTYDEFQRLAANLLGELKRISPPQDSPPSTR